MPMVGDQRFAVQFVPCKVRVRLAASDDEPVALVDLRDVDREIGYALFYGGPAGGDGALDHVHFAAPQYGGSALAFRGKPQRGFDPFGAKEPSGVHRQKRTVERRVSSWHQAKRHNVELAVLENFTRCVVTGCA